MEKAPLLEKKHVTDLRYHVFVTTSPIRGMKCRGASLELRVFVWLIQIEVQRDEGNLLTLVCRKVGDKVG